MIKVLIGWALISPCLGGNGRAKYSLARLQRGISALAKKISGEA
jgi:hypothetical protein